MTGNRLWKQCFLFPPTPVLVGFRPKPGADVGPPALQLASMRGDGFWNCPRRAPALSGSAIASLSHRRPLNVASDAGYVSIVQEMASFFCGVSGFLHTPSRNF